MRIIVAETAGFCWGVQRAIDTALDVSKTTGKHVYTYGPLIHNTQVVDELKKKNITDLEGEVEDASDGSLVIRAHGVRPDVMEEIKSRHTGVIDATCPLVTKVHRKIQINLESGYSIYIMGTASHPEVVGLVGSSNDTAVVIPPDEKLVEGMDIREKRICLVSQTTQNYETFEKVATALSQKCEELLVINTICEPTRSHQTETADIAGKVDLVVVVGGKHSANTRHLAELAGSFGPKVIHVETDQELEADQFRGIQVVGVTAGASTPQWMIRRVVDRLKSFDGKTGLLKGLIKASLEILVPTNLHTVLAFGSIYLAITSLLGAGFSISALLESLAVVFGIHCINEFGDDTGFDRKSRLSPGAYRSFRQFMLLLSATALVFGMLFSAFEFVQGEQPLSIFIVLFLAGTGGVLYGWKLVPGRYIERFGFRSIQDLPGSKDLSVSLGWTMLLGIIPALSGDLGMEPVHLLIALIVMVLVYRRSSILAVRDVQGDRIVGMESSFKFLGKVRSRRLHILIDTLSLVFIPVLFLLFSSHLLAVSMSSLGILLGFLLSVLYRLRRLPDGITGQFLIDLQFVIPGFLGLALGWLPLLL